jgi:RNA polymerase sigma factor (sigma-70 family)
MALKDQALVQQTLDGHPHAFGYLVDRYAVLVHGVILEIVRRPGEVEDLSQETFSRAFEELSRLQNPSKFGPWLGQIAANAALDWLRSDQTRFAAQHDTVINSQIAERSIGRGFFAIQPC